MTVHIRPTHMLTGHRTNHPTPMAYIQRGLLLKGFFFYLKKLRGWAYFTAPYNMGSFKAFLLHKSRYSPTIYYTYPTNLLLHYDIDWQIGQGYRNVSLASYCTRSLQMFQLLGKRDWQNYEGHTAKMQMNVMLTMILLNTIMYIHKFDWVIFTTYFQWLTVESWYTNLDHNWQ